MDIMLADLPIITDKANISATPDTALTEANVEPFVMMFADIFEKLSIEKEPSNSIDLIESKSTNLPTDAPSDDFIDNQLSEQEVIVNNQVITPEDKDIQVFEDTDTDTISLAPVVAWLSFISLSEPDKSFPISNKTPSQDEPYVTKAQEQVDLLVKNKPHSDIDVHSEIELEQENPSIVKKPIDFQYQSLEKQISEPTEVKAQPIEPLLNKSDSMHIQNQTAVQSTSTQTQTIATKNIHIQTPIHQQQQWTEEFSQHIAWLGKQTISSAMIHLNPKDLGPISLMLSVHDDVAKLSIQTDHQQVRNLISDGLPKLKDMMLEQGVNLTDIQFDNQSRQSTQQDKQQQRNIQDWHREQHIMDDEPNTVIIKKGLVDYFA